MPNVHLNHNLSTVPDYYNTYQDDYSESDDKPLWLLSSTATRKEPSKDSFTWTLQKQVESTQLHPTIAQPQCFEHREINIVSEQEDEPEIAPLASKKD